MSAQRSSAGRTPAVRGQLRVGTSGWSYGAWRGMFYPHEVRPNHYLAYYAKHFTTVEVNATAYRMPTAALTARWRSQVPSDFRFAIKLHHSFTHRQRLRGGAGSLHEFLAALEPFGEQLGPLLVQLPPRFAPEPERLADFLDLLRSLANPDQPLRVAVEFRHPGWLTPRIDQLLAQRGVARCIADMPYARSSVGNCHGFAYLRRHGPEGTYTGSYAESALEHDAEQIRGWLADGCDVYAYFNNTMHGDALTDARHLLALISDSETAQRQPTPAA